MRDQIGQLQQARLLHTCKIRNVGEVIYRPPCCTPLSEVVHPDFGSLVEPTLSEDQ